MTEQTAEKVQIELTEDERAALLHGWGNFMDDYLDTVRAIIAVRVAGVGAKFAEWAAKNEIAEPPLDWAWFGEIVRWTESEIPTPPGGREASDG